MKEDKTVRDAVETIANVGATVAILIVIVVAVWLMLVPRAQADDVRYERLHPEIVGEYAIEEIIRGYHNNMHVTLENGELIVLPEDEVIDLSAACFRHALATSAPNTVYVVCMQSTIELAAWLVYVAGIEEQPPLYLDTDDPLEDWEIML